MDLIHTRLHQGVERKALVLEAEGLVAERVRRMLAELDVSAVWIDRAALFRLLRASLPFDAYVVGLSSPADLDGLELEALEPLVVLAPLGERERVSHYRMVLPSARLIDRALADPDALRRALGATTARERAAQEGVDRPALVRRAFEPFDLSRRQLEVLGRALLGESSREIARRLYISELTVRNHRHAIYERVGVSGRRELLGRFVRGLVDEGSA